MHVTAGSPPCGDGAPLVLHFLQTGLRAWQIPLHLILFSHVFVIFASGDNLQECDRLGRRGKREMQKLNIKTAGWQLSGDLQKAGLCKALPRPEDAEREMQRVCFPRFHAFAAFESSRPFILIRKVLPLLASYPSAICASACFCAFKTLTAILIITWSNTQTTHRNLLNFLICFAFIPPTFEANKPLCSRNESGILHAQIQTVFVCENKEIALVWLYLFLVLITQPFCLVLLVFVLFCFILLFSWNTNHSSTKILILKILYCFLHWL